MTTIAFLFITALVIFRQTRSNRLILASKSAQLRRSFGRRPCNCRHQSLDICTISPLQMVTGTKLHTFFGGLKIRMELSGSRCHIMSVVESKPNCSLGVRCAGKTVVSRSSFSFARSYSFLPQLLADLLDADRLMHMDRAAARTRQKLERRGFEPRTFRRN